MARLIMFTAVAGLIMFTAVGLVPGVHYAGASHLLGAFLAGFCFCSDPRSHHVWVRQVKRIMYWLLTLFFGCTIGFEVPVRTMFTGPVIGAASCYLAIRKKRVRSDSQCTSSANAHESTCPSARASAGPPG